MLMSALAPHTGGDSRHVNWIDGRAGEDPSLGDVGLRDVLVAPFIPGCLGRYLNSWE